MRKRFVLLDGFIKSINPSFNPSSDDSDAEPTGSTSEVEACIRT